KRRGKIDAGPQIDPLDRFGHRHLDDAGNARFHCLLRAIPEAFDPVPARKTVAPVRLPYGAKHLRRWGLPSGTHLGMQRRDQGLLAIKIAEMLYPWQRRTDGTRGRIAGEIPKLL